MDVRIRVFGWAAAAPAVAVLLLLTLVPPGHAQPYPNVKVNVLSNDPEETSIAVNPSDVRNILGVAQVPCRTYVSLNSGATWDEGQLPDPYDLGDPCVVFDRTGTAFYCYIGTWSHSGIFINRSTDGGVSWLPAAPAVIEHLGDTPFEDKPYPVCDWTEGPHAGNVYVAWTQFDHYASANPADSTRILFARSTNGGLSYQPPVRVSDRGGNALDSDDTVEGAVPAVGPDGSVFMAWSGPRGIEFDRSTDGGMSFGQDRVIADQPGGWDFGVAGIFRCNGLPITKADISHTAFRGRIYVCWSDQRYGDTDVFLIHSDDDGLSWSPRIRVNDDPLGNGRDQFFPWIDVDAVTGKVYVVFYDRREHADFAVDVYLAVSEDGGNSFDNVKISAQPFDPDPLVFFGDYIGISAYAGWVRPLWMRFDESALSIWTALIDPHPSELPSCETAPALVRLVPNPVRQRARMVFCGPVDGAAVLSIVDVQGREVRRLPSMPVAFPGATVDLDAADSHGEPLPSGIYLVRAGGRKLGRFVVVR